MRVGSRRHLVEIEHKVDATPVGGTLGREASGAPAFTWTLLVSLWASVEPLAGAELIRAGAAQSEVTTRIRTDYMPNITSEMRVKFDGHYYAITSAISRDSRNRELEIMCVRGGANG